MKRSSPSSSSFSRYGYNEGVVIEEPFTQDRDGDNVRVDITRPFRVRTFIPQENFDTAHHSMRSGVGFGISANCVGPAS